jgi:hypothetical protein
MNFVLKNRQKGNRPTKLGSPEERAAVLVETVVSKSRDADAVSDGHILCSERATGNGNPLPKAIHPEKAEE